MTLKMRQWFNVLLGAILTFMGYGCDRTEKYGVVNPTFPDVPAKYGTPTADLIFEGQVTNEEKAPLANMQIVHREGWQNSEGGRHWSDYADTIYTNAEGKYNKAYKGTFPLELHKVIVNDTAGVYQSDSTVTNVTYSGGDGDWYSGKGELKVDFTLKKK